MQHIRFWSTTLLPRLAHFTWRVLCAFVRNRGVLLAGGVGYNVMLSIVPLLALLGVLLTHIVDEQQLLGVIAIQAQHLTPAHADILIDAVRALLDSREAIGNFGIVVLLVFSSFAFRMLEDAMGIIFHQPDNPIRRSAWVSALLPYAFMLVLGSGILSLTLLVSATSAINELLLVIFGHGLPLAGLSVSLLNLLSFIGVFVLFSGIYKVLPVVRISLHRAVVGGFVAALLWEGVRLLLIFYFAQVSFVNAVYGSLATLIVVLISLEVGAIILLLGGQVIAELEHSHRVGVAWHIDPRRAVVTHVD